MPGAGQGVPALAEQHRQREPARLNRARNAVTHQVRFVVRSNVSIHAAYLAVMSGQLRFLGSCAGRNRPPTLVASGVVSGLAPALQRPRDSRCAKHQGPSRGLGHRSGLQCLHLQHDLSP